MRPRVAVVLFNLGGPDRPEAIKQREFAKFSGELVEVTTRLQSLFEKEHSKIVALRNQLIERVGASKGDNAKANSLIDSGSVSEADPLGQIADYLDQLAERLPDGS